MVPQVVKFPPLLWLLCAFGACSKDAANDTAGEAAGDAWKYYAGWKCDEEQTGEHNYAGRLAADAKAACDADPTCKAVYDWGCNNWWTKCTTGYKMKEDPEKNSCVYVKPTIERWKYFEGWECDADHTGEHNGAGRLAEDAKTACDADPTCGAVFDWGCNNWWTKCTIGYTLKKEASKPSCLFIKAPPSERSTTTEASQNEVGTPIFVALILGLGILLLVVICLTFLLAKARRRIKTLAEDTNLLRAHGVRPESIGAMSHGEDVVIGAPVDNAEASAEAAQGSPQAQRTKTSE